MGQPEFPLVDAILVTPEEAAENGRVGVCTNSTMAPGQVYGEVEPDLTPFTAVYGSLKVNRDGTERMILNSLVHPNLQQVVLFGTETSSFRPSTNLLLALQYGIDPADSNRINNGQTKSAQYPNLSVDHIDYFRDNITVLPIYMSEVPETRQVVENYLEWLSPRIDPEVIELLRQINSRPKKIYYDSLNQLIRHLGGASVREKIGLQLDPADFQQLQPPVREVVADDEKLAVPFTVTAEAGQVRVNLRLADGTYSMSESNPFLLGYSLMKQLGDRINELSPAEQLLLGAEVARVNTGINNDSIEAESFVLPGEEIETTQYLSSEPLARLKTDSLYYYMVRVKDNEVAVSCMAHDQCEQVYELRSASGLALLKQLAVDDRFEDYEMAFLHRFDVGCQVGRATIAAQNGYDFVQDFDNIFKVNTSNMPLLTVEADSFLTAHQGILRRVYTEGLTAEHGDKAKGLARTAGVLAVWRASDDALATMERMYKQGDRTTEQIRSDYKAQLLRRDHDGSYSYGERTRTYFEHDQLERVSEVLQANPTKAAIIQRFDPLKDMEYGINPDTGEAQSSEDPCLTHDIYFVMQGRLHAFHIARAHNIVNAYPENIFGLHDAYDTTIAEKLNLPLGDMFMLSSRANILLLTEEQKAQKIMSAPVKPLDDTHSTATGPYKLGETIQLPQIRGGVAFVHQPLDECIERPTSPILDRIEDLHGVDTVSRAVGYLRSKGLTHNNPVLSDYRAGENDPQGEHLAFFQANVVGTKLYASAVFTNRSLDDYQTDIDLANYLATRYTRELDVELGDLSFFSVGYR